MPAELPRTFCVLILLMRKGAKEVLKFVKLIPATIITRKAISISNRLSPRYRFSLNFRWNPRSYNKYRLGGPARHVYLSPYPHIASNSQNGHQNSQLLLSGRQKDLASRNRNSYYLSNSSVRNPETSLYKSRFSTVYFPGNPYKHLLRPNISRPVSSRSHHRERSAFQLADSFPNNR